MDNTFDSNIIQVAGPNLTINTVFEKLFVLTALSAGALYLIFAILLFFRTQSLNRSLKTEGGSLVMLMALANLVMSAIISILGFFLAIV